MYTNQEAAYRLMVEKSIFQALYDQSLFTTLPIPCRFRKWLLLLSTVFQG